MTFYAKVKRKKEKKAFFCLCSARFSPKPAEKSIKKQRIKLRVSEHMTRLRENFFRDLKMRLNFLNYERTQLKKFPVLLVFMNLSEPDRLRWNF